MASLTNESPIQTDDLHDEQHAPVRDAMDVLDQENASLREQNALLRRKTAQLERLDDAAQKFLDHVSHEFRTPLTVVKEYAAILAEGLAGPISARQREFLDIIDSRTEEMALLVDDLQDTVRLRAGTAPVHRKDCIVSDMVERIRAAIETKAAKRGIQIAIDIEDALPHVFCDPGRAGRALKRLVALILKTCNDGSRIVVWARKGDTANQVLVGVSDEELAATLDDRRQMLERLRPSEHCTTGATQAGGPEMEIVRELVAVSFGQFGIAGTPGRHGTFWFTLPDTNLTELARRYLAILAGLEETTTCVSLLHVQATSSPDQMFLEELDQFLNHHARGHSVVFRLADDRWLALLECGAEEADRTARRWPVDWSKITGPAPGSRLPALEVTSQGTWRIPDDTQRLVEQIQADVPCPAHGSGGESVLVVEDDRDFADGLHFHLRAAGYAAQTARDAETALKMASQCHPNAILLDNSLPGMNGIEALDELKRNPETRDIPVIMVSANTKLPQTALVRDADFYLQKPCGFDKIVSALRNVLA